MPFWLVGWVDDVSGVEQVIPNLFAIDHINGVDCASRVSFHTHTHLTPFPVCE
jgi:hypothetical protein